LPRQADLADRSGCALDGATSGTCIGRTRFLTKALDKVRTEMRLQVLTCNMKRMTNIFGIKRLTQAIAA
jgi:hypothetical protein